MLNPATGGGIEVGVLGRRVAVARVTVPVCEISVACTVDVELSVGDVLSMTASFDVHAIETNITIAIVPMSKLTVRDIFSISSSQSPFFSMSTQKEADDLPLLLEHYDIFNRLMPNNVMEMVCAVATNSYKSQCKVSNCIFYFESPHKTACWASPVPSKTPSLGTEMVVLFSVRWRKTNYCQSTGPKVL